MANKISREATSKGKFVTQNVEAEISIYDESRYEWKDYKLTGLETENTKFGKVDMATATVVPSDTDYYVPRFDDEVEITVNGTRVFTGYVGEVKEKDGAVFELKCFNAVRKLKNTTINVGTEEMFVKARNLLTNVILPKVGIEEYSINMEDTEFISLKGGAQTKRKSAKNTNIKFTQANSSLVKLIDRVAKFTNSVWYIDAYGHFQFGDPDTEVYNLSYVKDTSAGKTTPPYQSVEVIGGASASQASWSDSEDIQKNPIKETRALVNLTEVENTQQIINSQDFKVSADSLTQTENRNRDVYRIVSGKLRDPVYTYRDKAIKTGRQAKAIANALASELVRQTRQGWVEIVGWSPIKVFDVIEMPDFMGGEQYLVQGVKHTLDTSNGFKTRIQCGGLMATGNTGKEVGGYE